MDDMNQNNDYGSSDNSGEARSSDIENTALKTSSFYTESYKKPQKRRGTSLIQLIAVALISSILGAFVFGAAFVMIAPNLQPSVKGYVNNLLTGKTLTTGGLDSSSGAIKQVQIVQTTTDSPVTAIAEKVGPTVVGIKVTFTAQDNFFFQTQQQQQGEGSGIIIRDNGYIMTNYHVVADALAEPNTSTSGLAQNSKIEVYLPSMPDKPYVAKYVGGDSRTDLAVIKIDATNLPIAEFGDSDSLKVGELAVAIGNPGGMELMGTVTAGVISGINRNIQTDTNTLLKLIQTDAAISPGSSGGALVNSKGQVIGINEQKIVATGFEGLGFAIPVNMATKITSELITNKYVTGRASLGVSINPTFTSDVAGSYNLPAGAYVVEATKGGPAAAAGVQPKDIITKINGVAVDGYNSLRSELDNKYKPGDTVTIEIYRRSTDGSSAKTVTLKVKLTELKQ